MQEEILLPFQKPSRISSNSQIASTHIIQLYEDIGHPNEYLDELNLINNAGEQDTIVLDICTDGGVLDTAMLFKRALFNTSAHTVAVIGPSCSSAGSILALSCKEHVLDDTSSLMIHTSTYGLVAKDTDIFEHANFSRKQLRKLYEDVYSGFLSNEDLEDVIKGTPFYFDADQLAERLEKMYDYRAALEDCECGECGAQPMLEDIISDLVDKKLASVKESEVLEKQKPTPRSRKQKTEQPE